MRFTPQFGLLLPSVALAAPQLFPSGGLSIGLPGPLESCYVTTICGPAPSASSNFSFTASQTVSSATEEATTSGLFTNTSTYVDTTATATFSNFSTAPFVLNTTTSTVVEITTSFPETDSPTFEDISFADVSTETSSEAFPDTTSDIFTEITSETWPETTSDVSPDTTTDIPPETTSDVFTDITSDIPPETTSDVLSDTTTSEDSTSDVTSSDDVPTETTSSDEFSTPTDVITSSTDDLSLTISIISETSIDTATESTPDATPTSSSDPESTASTTVWESTATSTFDEPSVTWTPSSTTVTSSRVIPTSTIPAAPTGVEIRSVTYGGSGCSSGSVSSQLAADKSTLTLLYGSFIAQTGPGLFPADARKNCQLSVAITYPHGWQYSIFKADYRGYASLGSGQRGVARAAYYFAGQTQQIESNTDIVGPYDNNYLKTDAFAVDSTVWSPCGKEGMLNINSEIRIAPLVSPNPALMTLDSADLKFTQVHYLAWQRC